MINIMKERFACRNYTDEKLSDELIKKIIDLARLSPSSLDMQPWQIYALSGKNLNTLSQICLNQSQVATCSHALVLAAHTDLRGDDKFFSEFITQKDAASRTKYLSFIGDRFNNMSDEQIYAYASNQCYMLAANLVNIAFELGVKSCMIGGFNREACDEFLKLDDSLKSVLVITLGRSDEKASLKNRRTLDNILKFVK